VEGHPAGLIMKKVYRGPGDRIPAAWSSGRAPTGLLEDKVLQKLTYCAFLEVEFLHQSDCRPSKKLNFMS